MRKIHHLNHVSLLAAVAAILTTSCKHDQIEQIDFNAELNKYVGTWNDSIKSSIDPNHDWNTSITTTITVNSAYEGTLRIFMERVFGNTAASLVTQDIAKGSTVLTIAKPQNADTLYAVIYDTEGYIREMPFEAKESTLTVDFSEQSANLPAMAKTRSMTSLAFMPLGLPADHPFWTDAAEPWTQVKAWGGQPFPKDHRWGDDIVTKDKW